MGGRMACFGSRLSPHRVTGKQALYPELGHKYVHAHVRLRRGVCSLGQDQLLTRRLQASRAHPPRHPAPSRRCLPSTLCSQLHCPSRGLAKRARLAEKSRYAKYPPVAPRNPPRATRDARGRLPTTVGARPCKRGKFNPPERARRDDLKNATKSTKNGPDPSSTVTRTTLFFFWRAGASSLPAPAARLETTRRVRLHVESQKTGPHRRPDVLAPGC